MRRNLYIMSIIVIALTFFLACFDTPGFCEESLKQHYKLGRKYYRQDRYEKAIEEFDAVLRIDPSHKRAAVYIKKAYVKLSEMKKEAKRIAREYTDDLERNMLIPYYKRGLDLIKEKKYLDAITELEKALEMDPDYKPARLAIKKAFSLYVDKEILTVEQKYEMEKKLRLLDVERAKIPILEEERAEKREEALEDVVKIVEKPKGVLRIEKEIAETKVSIDFKDADLKEVVRYLVEISGINIVLDETVFATAEETAIAQPEPSQFEFGQETEEGETTTDWGEPFSPQEKKAISPKVSIFVKDIPLVKALDIILRAKGLKYKIEEDFIWVSTPANLMREDLETRIYSLKHLTGRFANFPAVPFKEGEMGVSEGQTGITPIGGENFYRRETPAFGAPPTMTPQVTAMTGLEEPSLTKVETRNIRDVLLQVVPQVPGSSITLYERLGKLIARNTPTNLEILERVLTALDVASLQVSLEIRVLEISSFKGEDFGINWSEVKEEAEGDERLLSIIHDIGDVGTQRLTGGLDFSYTLLNDPELNIVLKALEKSKNVSVLSAPKLTCLNNQTANIRVLTTHSYISRWNRQTHGYPGLNQYYWGESWEPMIGQIGEGLILEITPNVSADRKTIALTVHPSIIEITAMERSGEADHPLTLPQTVSRNVDTTVSIKNTHTLVLGGLMKNNEGEDIRKVPILGDIPILGGLFRAKTKYKSQSNLLIFITGRILNAEGEKLES